jgi:hypothetical protein
MLLGKNLRPFIFGCPRPGADKSTHWQYSVLRPATSLDNCDEKTAVAMEKTLTPARLIVGLI